jgi:hypothetical protein
VLPSGQIVHPLIAPVWYGSGQVSTRLLPVAYESQYAHHVYEVVSEPLKDVGTENFWVDPLNVAHFGSASVGPVPDSDGVPV